MRLFDWKSRATHKDDRFYREMKTKLEQLEKAVDRSNQRPAEYHVSIEHLHVDRPVLEQLLFRLDRLDVDEISGSLNLGNNFGTASNRQMDERSMEDGDQQEKPQQNEKKASKGKKEPGMDKTHSGFRFRL